MPRDDCGTASVMSPSEYQDLVAVLGQRFEVIDRGFEAVDRRFDAIDRRFEAVDRGFDRIEGDLAGFRVEFSSFRADVLGHFDEIYRRLDRLERPRGPTGAVGERCSSATWRR